MPKLRHGIDLNSAKVMYVVIGILVYVCELVVIFIASRLQHNDLVSVGLSFWIGLTLSFLLQKLVTFKDTRTEKHILLPQIIAVCVLVLFNFVFTLCLTKLLRSYMSPFIIRTLAIAATTLWNFYIYKTRIFKDNRTIPID